MFAPRDVAGPENDAQDQPVMAEDTASRDKVSDDLLNCLLSIPVIVEGDLGNPRYQALMMQACQLIFDKFFVQGLSSKHSPALYSCCNVWGEYRTLSRKGHPREFLLEKDYLIKRGVVSAEGLQKYLVSISEDPETGLIRLPKVSIDCTLDCYESRKEVIYLGLGGLQQSCNDWKKALAKAQWFQAEKCVGTDGLVDKREQACQTTRSSFPQNQTDLGKHKEYLVKNAGKKAQTENAEMMMNPLKSWANQKESGEANNPPCEGRKLDEEVLK